MICINCDSTNTYVKEFRSPKSSDSGERERWRCRDCGHSWEVRY